MILAADVVTALLDRAAGLTHGSPKMKLAMPDVVFVPVTGQPFFRIDHFPNAPFWSGLNSGRVDQGLLQITVVWPKGRGIVKASAAVDAIKAHFPKALRLTHGTATVKIGEAWHANPLQDDAWTETPVTIPWTAS